MAYFDSLPLAEESWPGNAPAAWAKHVLGDTDTYELPQELMKRAALQEYCARLHVSDDACFIAIMAWGGQHPRNARTAWKHKDKWLPVISRLRRAKLSRGEGYRLFYDLRPDSLPGVGPAYFTKLLFFLIPGAGAYILDQWTAKSMQVLLGCRNFPKLKIQKKAAQVSDVVTPEEYEQYCDLVDELADRSATSGFSTELKLFCRGGRKPGPWRAYVKSAWPTIEG